MQARSHCEHFTSLLSEPTAILQWAKTAEPSKTIHKTINEFLVSDCNEGLSAMGIEIFFSSAWS